MDQHSVSLVATKSHQNPFRPLCYARSSHFRSPQSVILAFRHILSVREDFAYESSPQLFDTAFTFEKCHFPDVAHEEFDAGHIRKVCFAGRVAPTMLLPIDIPPSFPAILPQKDPHVTDQCRPIVGIL
jgi:hypothetical protein